MAKILLTGFEKFGQESMNPTELLMTELSQRLGEFAPAEVRVKVLPVTFADAFKVLESEARDFDPDFIVSFGLAANRRPAIEIERLAINILDASIPDNDGKLVRDEPIVPDGEVALMATLPIRAFEKALKDAGVPVVISNTAGTYVCNYLMYKTLEMCRFSKKRAGFVHVPHLLEHVKGHEPRPHAIHFETLVRAAEILIAEISNHS